MRPSTWADQLVGELSKEVRADLAADPASAMRRHFGLIVRESSTLSQRGDGGWCDGMSFRRQNEVLYAPSPFSKRKYFTMLHELAHKLTDDEEDEEILDWLGELKNERQVVEQVCDFIAGRLLVPDWVLEEVLEGKRPTGQALARLYLNPNLNASREASAVALSRRLGCPGFIAVIRDGTVTFTSRLGEPTPVPSRNVPLPTSHPLRSMQHGEIQAIESWWPDFAGIRHRYYQHAKCVGHWTYAAFAENDLWGVARLHLPAEEKRVTRSRPVDFECPHCGLKRRTRTFWCNTCHSPICPQCEYCQICDQKAKKKRGICNSCTQSVLIHLLDTDGYCPACQ